MIDHLKRYLDERCPLQVCLPLAAVLYLAPAMLGAGDGWPWIRGIVSTWLILTVLRMVDDLADMPLDRRRHPGRGLVSGHIRPEAIRNAALWGALLVMGLNFSWPRIAGVAFLLGWYVVYYGSKARWPAGLQPLGVNLVFFIFPFYALGWRGASVWMALFVGAAVVAHDLAHSVHARDEGLPGPATCSMQWGPRRTVWAAAAFQAAAALAALALWLTLGRPPVFIVCLAGMCAWLGVLYGRLLRRPCLERARAFYVAGFVFFVLPLAGLILDLGLGIWG